ncbi:MAG: ferritin [Sedimentisphaerales bacterium]|nr:ferritin [Sedimentisphaerales bacterium]
MISKKMLTAINEQIKNELYSAYLYLSMAAWAVDNDFEGMANWFRVQQQEETFHAMKFYDYIVEQGGRVKLLQIDEPPHDFKSPVKVFEDTLAHEKKVTAMIHALMNQAIAEKDHATQILLQWYVSEQVEEEASATQILKRIRLAGDNPGALFMLDQQLGQRTFTPPASAEA